MRKAKFLAIFMVLIFAFSSCYTLTHVVGSGAKGGQTTEKRQWYALWGLVPINEVDSKMMAGDARDYTIVSQHTFVDLVISAFTGMVTVQCKTVKVTK